MSKLHANPGVVAQRNLGTIYQREIFFQVDPATLDYIDHADMMEEFPSGFFVDFQPEQYLHYLPELEREIFYMVYTKQKNQKDIAKLLFLSQPTVSYRYRRALEKLRYLVTLQSSHLDRELARLEFLNDKEKSILKDLFFSTNQELVGRKFEVRQSTVKWIFVKTKRRVGERERKDPDLWYATYALLLLLERNLATRVLH